MSSEASEGKSAWRWRARVNNPITAQATKLGHQPRNPSEFRDQKPNVIKSYLSGLRRAAAGNLSKIAYNEKDENSAKVPRDAKPAPREYRGSREPSACEARELGPTFLVTTIRAEVKEPGSAGSVRQVEVKVQISIRRSATTDTIRVKIIQSNLSPKDHPAAIEALAEWIVDELTDPLGDKLKETLPAAADELHFFATADTLDNVGQGHTYGGW